MTRPVPPKLRSESIAQVVIGVLVIAALTGLALLHGLNALLLGASIGFGSFSLGIGLAQRLYR